MVCSMHSVSRRPMNQDEYNTPVCYMQLTPTNPATSLRSIPTTSLSIYCTRFTCNLQDPQFSKMTQHTRSATLTQAVSPCDAATARKRVGRSTASNAPRKRIQCIATYWLVYRRPSWSSPCSSVSRRLIKSSKKTIGSSCLEKESKTRSVCVREKRDREKGRKRKRI